MSEDADFYIIRDRDALSDADYRKLVNGIDALAKSFGAQCVELVRSQSNVVRAGAESHGPRVVAGPSGHKRVKCPRCLVTIEYAPKDLRRHDGTDISGGPDGREWVVCPGCGGEATTRSW